MTKHARSRYRAPSPTFEIFEEGESFRLITILPADTWEAPIVCRSFLASLTQPCAYDALSYDRGKCANTVPVTVDGVEVLIPPDLDTFLRYQRGQFMTDHVCQLFGKTVWIGALCIDEQDPNDHTFYARCVRQIFHNATAVTAWIGDFEPHSPDEIAAAFAAVEIVTELLISNPDPRQLLGRADFAVELGPGLRTLVQLLRRPWFRSLWSIHQTTESSSRKRDPRQPPIVRCGLHTASLADLLPICNHGRFLYDTKLGEDLALSPVRHLLDVRLSLSSEHLTRRDLDALGISPIRLNLSWLARLIVCCVAPDPRDTFYGLLGLLPTWLGNPRDMDTLHPLLRPNYHAPLDKVYRSYMVHCFGLINDEGDITTEASKLLVDLLINIFFSTEFSRAANPPPWVSTSTHAMRHQPKPSNIANEFRMAAIGDATPLPGTLGFEATALRVGSAIAIGPALYLDLPDDGPDHYHTLNAIRKHLQTVEAVLLRHVARHKSLYWPDILNSWVQTLSAGFTKSRDFTFSVYYHAFVSGSGESLHLCVDALGNRSCPHCVQLATHVRSRLWMKSPVVLSTGEVHLAWFRPGVELNDELVVLKGANTPYFMRRNPFTGLWRPVEPTCWRPAQFLGYLEEGDRGALNELFSSGAERIAVDLELGTEGNAARDWDLDSEGLDPGDP